MAERLTEKKNDKYVIDGFKTDFAVDLRKNCLHSLYGEPVNKLGKLEDILEKYGIDGVEELDNKLQNLIFITSTMNDYSITNWEELDTVLKNFSFTKKQEKDREEIYKNMQQDRNTWKKTCELIVKELNKLNTDKCKFCCYQESNKDYGSCDCDEQFELDRTINYFYQQAETEGNDERN